MRTHDEDLMINIRHLQETMEQLLKDFSRLRMPLLLSKESVWRPLTDVYETEREFVVRMEIPGMQADDFRVTLEDHMLIIRGTRRDPTPAVRKRFHKMEITLGPFERSIEVPSGFHISSMAANYENGFLIIRMTKGARELAAGERIIPVERGV